MRACVRVCVRACVLACALACGCALWSTAWLACSLACVLVDVGRGPSIAVIAPFMNDISCADESSVSGSGDDLYAHKYAGAEESSVRGEGRGRGAHAKQRALDVPYHSQKRRLHHPSVYRVWHLRAPGYPGAPLCCVIFLPLVGCLWRPGAHTQVLRRPALQQGGQLRLSTHVYPGVAPMLPTMPLKPLSA